MTRLILGVGLAGLLALGMAGNAMADGYEFASGAGEAGEPGSVKQFNFTAHNNTQGVVGQMHLDQAVADVSCLNTMGNHAILAGTITRGEGSLSTGGKIIFDVYDNDNGNSGTPPLLDAFLSSAGPGPASDADCTPQGVPNVLTRGNIVVNNGTKLLALGWPWP